MKIILPGVVSVVCLISSTCCQPLAAISAINFRRNDASPDFLGQSTRIARSDQSSLQSTDEHYGSHEAAPVSQGGFEPSTGHLNIPHPDFHQHEKFDDGHHEGNYFGHEALDDLHGHDLHIGNHVHSVPISEHIEVTKPVAVPVYKEIGVPVPHPVKINVPHPVAVGVPQPYPVAVPVQQPVPVQIIKTVAVPVEKKIPYPVEKHIPVPIEKPVPITIERHIPVPVEKPYPIKIPVYKTIYHHAKSHSYHHH